MVQNFGILNDKIDTETEKEIDIVNVEDCGHCRNENPSVPPVET